MVVATYPMIAYLKVSKLALRIKPMTKTDSINNSQKGVRIVFQVDLEDPNWGDWVDPMGGLTRILTEHWNAEDIPPLGYRFRQYTKLEKEADSNFLNASTHSRVGDWVVSGVERYVAKANNCEFREIAICTCRFEPVEPQWQKMNPSQTTLTHFS